MNTQKISIVKKYGPFCCWYEDENNILKGEWGGFKQLECEEAGETKFLIYYSERKKYIPINEYGFFYDKFDCRKYDGVYNIYKNLYITEKNGKYGLVDENDCDLLHTCYNSIRHVIEIEKYDLFLVASETGMFLYNYSLRLESVLYEEIKEYGREQLVFRLKEKYGIIDLRGNIILDARYEYNNKMLYGVFKGNKYGVCVKNNLLNGRFPIDNSVSYMHFADYAVTYKNGKYGILYRNHIVEDNILDDIIINKINGKGFECCKWKYIVIAKKDNKYRMYNVAAERCLVADCDEISYVYKKGRFSHVIFVKDGNIGYVTKRVEVLDKSEFDDIKIVDDFFMLSRAGKVGVMYKEGGELFPCIYDKITRKDSETFILVKDGIEEEYRIESTKKIQRIYEPEPRHYDRFGGIYGYSDEDIDTIFDGDPSAYWNID